MRYAIIANPASGKMKVDQKRSVLARAAEILDSDINGLDTETPEEFTQCAQELATRCDLLVVAGGDGTLSDIINSIDTAKIPIGFLPLGTGNAMRHALGYKGDLADIAVRIRDSNVNDYDLIDCDGKRRAFMASVGLEGAIVKLWDRYRDHGGTGFKVYLRAVLNAYFKEYERTVARITTDDKVFEVQDLLSLMVVKQPYYGFGMKVVPRARFDDRQLHILCSSAGLLESLMVGVSAFTIGNLLGEYCTGRELSVQLKRPQRLQLDGNAAWAANSFSFKVLPRALRIKC